MNERIKELANIWASRRAEDEKLGIVYTFSEPALEKFAELIVQECLLAISQTPIESDEIGTMVRCHNQVEQHFGVEE